MAIQVEHEKRKKEILEKARDLFIKDGYADVTFQKIADRCGITRTTLYIYYENKQQVFIECIKQVTDELENNIAIFMNDKKLSSLECLEKIFDETIKICTHYYKIFRVVLDHLLQLQKTGVDINRRLNRRTIRIRHIISTVIIRGQNKGEIKKLPVKEINDLLFSSLYYGIYNVGITETPNLQVAGDSIKFVIKNLLQ